MNCKEQFGNKIVLQVSPKPHTGFAFPEVQRSGLLLAGGSLLHSVALWYHLSDSL